MQTKKILETLAHIPAQDEFPTADAVAIKEVTTYRISSNRSVTLRRLVCKRVFKDFDRDRRSDVHMRFDETKQKVKILTAASMNPEGVVVETPEYGINQITPPEFQKAPYFAPFQDKIVSLVGIEMGGYTELEYEVEDSVPWRSLIQGIIPLRTETPALTRQIVFETPADMEFDFRLLGKEVNAVKPEIVVAGSIKRTTFTFTNLDLWDPEDAHPLAQADCPKLLFSERISWSEAAGRLRRTLEQASFADEIIGKRVDGLLKDIQCPFMRSFRLQKHVAEAIDTIDLPGHFNQYAARAAAEVLRSGYGTAFEKAILLCTMLNHAGLKAELIAACPLPGYAQDIALLPMFESFWVRVAHLGLYLRPDKSLTEARREHLEQCMVLALGNEGSQPTLLPDSGSPMGNRLDIKATVTLKNDGTSEGSVDAVFGCTFNPYYELYGEDSDKVLDWVKGFVGKIWPGAELGKHHFRQFGISHAALTATFTGKGMKEDLEHRFSLQFPALLSGIGGISLPVQINKRMSTYALPGTLQQKTTFEVTIPEDFAVFYRPAPITAASDVGDFEQRIEIKETTEKPTTITFTQQVQFKRKFVAPEHYTELHRIIVEDAKPQHRLLLFVKR